MNAVKILGREYKLRGEPDEAHLDEVVAYLSEVLREVQARDARHAGRRDPRRAQRRERVDPPAPDDAPGRPRSRR